MSTLSKLLEDMLELAILPTRIRLLEAKMATVQEDLVIFAANAAAQAAQVAQAIADAQAAAAAASTGAQADVAQDQRLQALENAVLQMSTNVQQIADTLATGTFTPSNPTP